MDPVLVATEFVAQYNNTYDNNPTGLFNFYVPGSTLTVDGQRVDGDQSIVDRLSGFQPCSHNTLSVDCLLADPENPDEPLIVMVFGDFVMTGTERKYTQTFHLYPQPEGGYFYT
ncbi:nuclear transport factor 2B-like [Papaver somniferum]|uniref:nuclear transport factor 2B-like n=1 Tax=Papaver somniferum TaxID=3469 RepID=UPI000E6FFDDF|nr:nuclear transport factor 2B-like [Papaver somniferum]